MQPGSGGRADDVRWSRWERWLLLLAALTAAGIRLIPWSEMVEAGRPLFFEPDAYYHLRRATIFLTTFPHVPGIDRYMAYPFGAECPWPPLYDAVVAALSAVLGGGRSGGEAILPWVATLLCPALAGLTVLLVAHVARRLAGPRAAVLSAILMIAVSGHLENSLIGSGDHHTAEALLLTAIILLCLAAVQQGAGRGRRFAVAGGAALGTATLVWQGSIAFAVFAVSGAMLYSVVPARKPGPEDPAPWEVRGHLATVCGVAGALVAATRLVYPSETPQTRFDFGFFSWFQPLFMGLLAAGLLLSSRLERLADRSGRFQGRGFRLVNATAGVMWPMLLLSLVPAFRDQVGGGVGFLLTRSAWLESIAEFQPYITWDAIRETVAARNVPALAYFVIIFGPAALCLLVLARGFREGHLGPGPALAIAWTLFVCVLAVGQRRWVNAYAINIAIGWGWISTAIGDRICAIPGIRTTSLRARRWAALVVFVPALASVLSASRYAFESPPPPAPLAPRFRSVLTWIREHTPPTAGWKDGRSRPEYAILSFWDFGHAIQHESRRATVANNFGSQLPGAGLEDTTRFFLAHDEEEMDSICSRRGARYVLATDLSRAGGVRRMSRMIGVDFDATVPVGAVPEELVRRLPYSRLLELDGSESPQGPALRSFRLLHESFPERLESGGFRDAMSVIKIFEHVPGAKVRGRALPHADVKLSCSFVSDAGRPFTYRSTVRAEASGFFQARFPYATAGRNGGTIATERPVARFGHRVVRFDVTDEEVRTGATVEIR